MKLIFKKQRLSEVLFEVWLEWL